MHFSVAALLLLLHLLFWGMGAALLLTPPRWRRNWAFFTPVWGVGLQSAVVWVAAHTTVAGTDQYAHAALIIPFGLLFAAWRGRGGWPLVASGLWRFRGVAVLMIMMLMVLMLPLGRVSPSLTSVSLGSCDAADYAAGARVLGEFASDDRGGFIGQTEVVGIHSVDNFFDYWLRLNHFTPSALLAFSNTVFQWGIHESPSVMAGVLSVAVLPMVFWVSRALFRLRPGAAFWVTGLYAFSPLIWYGVWHVALGQMLAATGIAVVTWCGVVLWRQGPGGGRGLAMAPLLACGYWVLLGSFNFIIVICLVPAASYAIGSAFWLRHWVRLLRWTGAMMAPLVVAGGLFLDRILGLRERFLLFEEHDFGWRIPALWPDGWLGFVSGNDLGRLPSDVSIALSACLVVALAIALFAAARSEKRGTFLALCTLLPIGAGYGFLQYRGATLGTNASYDAYKLLVVFYPLIVPALCFWLTGTLWRDVRWRAWGVLMLGLIAWSQAGTAAESIRRMQGAPLVVNQALVNVQVLESAEDISSLNLRIDDFWTRLWTNAFLLRKEQYFSEHTYEGRRNTPLRGEWDLYGGLIRVRARGTQHGLEPQGAFSAVEVGDSEYLRARAADGWYSLEQIPGEAPWRWTSDGAVIVLEHPDPEFLEITCALIVSSNVERDFQLWQDEEKIHQSTVGAEPTTVIIESILLRPGSTRLQLRSDDLPFVPGGGDGRRLLFMIRSVEFTPQMRE